MDANEDVRTGEIGIAFQALGLKEAILALHSEQKPPATHNRNQSRTPIDGIWTSRGIQAIAGGYGAFGDACPSDHRMLWLDITYASSFGYAPAPLLRPKARKLKANDGQRVLELLRSYRVVAPEPDLRR
jgi:hypothetical protein